MIKKYSIIHLLIFYENNNYDRNSSDSTDYCETCHHDSNSRDFYKVKIGSKKIVFNRAKLLKIGSSYFLFLQ